ncbi:MAG: oligosaccharide flippase family protein [Melioribacteraceae bacterium]|nr:oligosaccharide flippase family protein [Melioribacteraceae bacterium]
MKEKIKELTKDTAIYGISTIVGRFIGFIIVPFYTHVINPTDFGIYSNIYAYLAFLNIVYIYGVDAAFLKFSSIAVNDSEKSRVFSTSFWTIFISSLLFSLLLYFLKPSICIIMELPENYRYLYDYLIYILFFDTLALIPFAYLRLQRKALSFAVIKFINIMIFLLLNIVLIVVFKMGLEGILISNLIASVFSFVALLPATTKYLKPAFDKNLFKRLLKFGIPYLPASMGAMIVQVIDRPLVLAMTDSATLGIYQANYKLGIFMMLFVSMFQYAWQPFFLNNAKEKEAKELFSKIFTLFLITTSMIWVVLSLFVEDFIKFQFLPGISIFGKDYISGVGIVPIILLGYLFHGLYINFTAGIYIEEKTTYFPLVTLAGAVTNVVINLLLIPIIGIYGAALATLASYLIMSSGLFIVSQKFYHLEYEYRKIIPLLILLFTSISIYYLLFLNNMLTIPYKFLFLSLFIIVLFASKIINLREVKIILSRIIRRR